MARRPTLRPLTKLLDASSMPVYVLDAERSIVYCNAACSRWLAVEAGDLIGTRCDYHSSQNVSPLQAVAAGLCPPPEVFRGERTTGEVVRAASNSSRRRAEFLPLAGDAVNCAGVLAIVEAQDLPPSDRETTDLVDARQLHDRLRALRQELGQRYRFDLLVGQSTAIRRIRDQVRVAVQSEGRVLIVGVPGSGREHVAKTIHFCRQEKQATELMVLDSSLLDAELLQSAVRQLKRHGGETTLQPARTLLLLDVDRLPIDAQHELAGFFHLPEFEIPTLATAQRLLLELAEDESFRPDLAATLSTLVIEMPPLRERPDDVPYLAQLFLEDENVGGGRQLSGFSPEAMDRLAAYHWPGNVDELSEIVHQACSACAGPLVKAAELPKRIHLAAEAAAHSRQQAEPIVLDDFLAEIEAELIQRALRQSKDNKTKAAELLGITRARLHRRISQLGINDSRQSFSGG